MSSDFSDKPYVPRREPAASYDHEAPAPPIQREPGSRLNWRKLLVGFALLFIATGLLFLCFIYGGLLNPIRHWDGSRIIAMDQAGHIVGYVLIGLGVISFIFLFSLEKRN